MSFVNVIVKICKSKGGAILSRYKVTVCGVGYAYVDAKSEQEAKEKAGSLFPEQINWHSRNGADQSLFVVYAEVVNTTEEKNK